MGNDGVSFDSTKTVYPLPSRMTRAAEQFFGPVFSWPLPYMEAHPRDFITRRLCLVERIRAYAMGGFD